MYVETFLHFREFLEAITPSLPSKYKTFGVQLFPWIEKNKNKNSGVDQTEIDNVVLWLVSIQPFYPSDPIKSDIYQCFNFLRSLNTVRAAKSLYTVAGCRFWDNFWWGGGCHEEEQVDPVDPPYEKTCSEWRDKRSCEKAGCSWYMNSCYASIPAIIEYHTDDLVLQYAFEYTVEMAKILAGKAQARLDYWMSIEGYPYFWADWMSFTEAFVNETNLAYMAVTYDMIKVSDWIGNIQDLQGKTVVQAIRDSQGHIGDMNKIPQSNLVDAILAVEGAEETIALALTENLLRKLDFSWSAIDGKITPHANGLYDNLVKIEAALIDEYGVVTIPTLKMVEEMLEEDYKIVHSTITDMNARIDALLVAVSAIIDVVSGEIDRERFPLEDHVLDWMPASFGWVKDKIRAVGNIIFDCIEEVTLSLADQINKIGTIVVSMPDWWIKELKIKLGI